MPMFFKNLFAILICYFVGSIPFGVLLGLRYRKSDVRNFGSGNIGTTNMLRTYGPSLGIPTFILDFGKGVFAYYLGVWMMLSPFVAMLCGFAVVAGHNWSIFLKFKGGKGVATTYGFVAMVSPFSFLIGFGVFLIISIFTRLLSLGSLIGSLVVVIMTFVFKSNLNFIILNIIFTVLLFIRHRENIKRLLSGKENKI